MFFLYLNLQTTTNHRKAENCKICKLFEKSILYLLSELFYYLIIVFYLFQLLYLIFLLIYLFLIGNATLCNNLFITYTSPLYNLNVILRIRHCQSQKAPFPFTISSPIHPFSEHCHGVAGVYPNCGGANPRQASVLQGHPTTQEFTGRTCKLHTFKEPLLFCKPSNFNHHLFSVSTSKSCKYSSWPFHTFFSISCKFWSWRCL